MASEAELGDDQLVGMGQRFLARAAQHGLGMSGHCRAVNDHLAAAVAAIVRPRPVRPRPGRKGVRVRHRKELG